jgi:hypothetical protein
MYSTTVETLHEGLTQAADLLRGPPAEEVDGDFVLDGVFVMEIEKPNRPQTTWGNPAETLTGALGRFDRHRLGLDLPHRSSGLNTIAIFDFLDLDMVEREVAAAFSHRYRTAGVGGNLILIYSQLRLGVNRETPPAPRLDQPDGIDFLDFEAWATELRMFLDEGAQAVGYQQKLFRKIVLPIAVGGDTLKSAKWSPWIEAARMGNEKE